MIGVIVVGSLPMPFRADEYLGGKSMADSGTQVTNLLKARLGAGETCLVLRVKLCRTLDIVGIARAAGYHGIYLDLQHSTMSLDAAAQVCTGAVVRGCHAAGSSAGYRSLDDRPVARWRSDGNYRSRCDERRSRTAGGRPLPDAAIRQPFGRRGRSL